MYKNEYPSFLLPNFPILNRSNAELRYFKKSEPGIYVIYHITFIYNILYSIRTQIL